MTKKNPKVSIIIPVYNGSNYLKDAINSALNQTYQNIEIIVVNDGSNDDGKTEEIALSYGNKIRYFSKPNGGVSTALNYGIDKMTGEYFSWLSHDDLYLPEKIATQIAKLNSLGTGKFILYSNVIYLIEKDNKEVPLSLKTIPPENFRYWLAKERALNGCALLIPKTAFSEIRTFDEDLRHTQDYDLWFDLATNYQFIHIPEFLVKFRCHDLQDSLKLPKRARLETDKLLSKFVTELTTEEITHATNTSLAISYRDLAYNFWSEGFNNAGNIAANMAIKHGLAKTELRSSFSVAFEAKLKKLKRIWLDFIYPIAEKMPASLRQAIKSILIKLHVVKK